MKITKDLIADKYQRFNKAYFAGRLPKIHFYTFRSKSTWGMMTYDPSNKWKSRIGIASNVDWNDTDLDGTILHEMAHLYLHLTDPRYRGRNPLYNRSHGRLFKREAQRLKEQSGIDIACKLHLKHIPPKGKKKRHNRLVQAIVDWVDRWIL